MKLPMYYIFGDRPVKFIKTEDGGADILAYDWETNDFIRDMTYLSKVWYDVEARKVTEEEFNDHVESLRKKEAKNREEQITQSPKKVISGKKIIIMIFSILGALLSGNLLYMHYGALSGSSLLMNMCSASGIFDCQAVASSSYSEIFGIPNAAYGFFFYCTIFGLTLFRGAYTRIKDSAFSKGILVVTGALSLAAVLGIFPLVYISIFLIKGFCLFCVLTWIINIILFIAILGLFKNEEEKTLFKSIAAVIQDSKPSFKSIYKDNRVYLFAFYSFILAIALVAFDGYAGGIAEHKKELKKMKQERSIFMNYFKNETAHINLDSVPVILGNPEAKVSIVEYIHFNCGACKRSYSKLQSMIPKYGDKVKLYIKNFPLDGLCNSAVKKRKGGNTCRAAILSVGLRDNWSSYKAFVDSLMLSENRFNRGLLMDAISASGLNTDEANSILTDKEIKVLLREEVNEAIGLGVNATPTIAINGKLFPAGIIPEKILDEIIRMEMKKVYGE
ncbi:MAG: thioredoxin domain-containing protein [bacterium]|nr:thioredoxin domain-containing protein [bacterium]